MTGGESCLPVGVISDLASGSSLATRTAIKETDGRHYCVFQFSLFEPLLNVPERRVVQQLIGFCLPAWGYLVSELESTGGGGGGGGIASGQ